MRARMALLVAGIQVELREVVLRDRPELVETKGEVSAVLRTKNNRTAFHFRRMSTGIGGSISNNGFLDTTTIC